MAPGSALKSVSRMKGSPWNCGYGQYWCGRQLLLHQSESADGSGVLMKVRNPLVLFLLSVLYEGCRDGGVVFNEPSIVPAFSPRMPSRFLSVSGIGQSLTTEVYSGGMLIP